MKPRDNSLDAGGARSRFNPPSNRDPQWLARPPKRHYTFGRRRPDHVRSGVGTALALPQSVDPPDVFVVTKAKRRCRDRIGRGEADVLAPFVYRLGRHPFTVERAVRFR